jgi:hypothetical protein
VVNCKFFYMESQADAVSSPEHIIIILPKPTPSLLWPNHNVQYFIDKLNIDLDGEHFKVQPENT